MEKLQQEYDVAIYWHAFQLRPPGSPPIPPEYRARIEGSRPLLQKRARDEYGIEINPGPFDIDSRPALIGAKYADAQGLEKGHAFHDAVMDAYWLEARAIDDPTVLREVATSVGLDSEEFKTALDNPHYEEEVDADVEQAAEYGLHAVPALIFANKYLVEGAQPYAILKRVIEKVQSEA